MSAILHLFVPLLSYYSLHIDPTNPSKYNELQQLFTIPLQNMCQQQKYPQMLHVCHVPKLLIVQQWDSMPKYKAHMGLTGINHVTRYAVHRQQ